LQQNPSVLDIANGLRQKTLGPSIHARLSLNPRHDVENRLSRQTDARLGLRGSHCESSGALGRERVFENVQSRPSSAGYCAGIMPCAYCAQPTVLRIPSVPDEVCLAHAIEFWTGLVAYAKDRLEGGQEKAPRGRGAS
jgi:hypothetical protein